MFVKLRKILYDLRSPCIIGIVAGLTAWGAQNYFKPQVAESFMYYYEHCMATMDAHNIYDKENPLEVANMKNHCINLASTTTCALGDCTWQ